MSEVLKSNRGQSSVQFLETANELRLYTIQVCSKFPKHYTFPIKVDLIACATRIRSCVKRGNSIFPVYASDYEMRRKEFVQAKAELYDLISQIDDAYNLFAKSCLTEKQVIYWLKLVDDEINLLTGKIKAEKEKYGNLPEVSPLVAQQIKLLTQEMEDLKRKNEELIMKIK